MKYKFILALLVVVSVVVYGELVVKKSNSEKKCQIEVINNIVYAGIINMVDLQSPVRITCPKMQKCETTRICKKRPMYNCCYIAGKE